MRTARAPRAAAALAAVLALLLAATACGQNANGVGRDSHRGGAARGGTVGIAMPTKSSERWIADGRNMARLFEAEGYEADLQFGNDDVDEQVSQIENMIAKGHRLLVIGAIDSAALTNVLRRAGEANIPVIAYDRLLMDTEHVDYYATFDNFEVGRLQARYIVDALGLDEEGGKGGGAGKGPYNIELFAGSPDDNNTRFFWDGAMSVLRPHLDGGRLVVRSGQTRMNQAATLRWDGGTAQKRMDDLLSRAYTDAEVDAVLSPYDGMSIGVLSALRSVGHGTRSRPFPIVTGQDAELASVKSIIAGEQTQTVYKDTRKLARQAVQMGHALLTGGEPEVNDTTSYHNGRKTVPAYLLEPVSIDRSNTQLLVDEGYFTPSQLK